MCDITARERHNVPFPITDAQALKALGVGLAITLPAAAIGVTAIGAVLAMQAAATLLAAALPVLAVAAGLAAAAMAVRRVVAVRRRRHYYTVLPAERKALSGSMAPALTSTNTRHQLPAPVNLAGDLYGSKRREQPLPVARSRGGH